MPRLLIIADDFTGALDTGVQFAACGIPTRVVVGTAADMIRCECTVLVVDTETRHLSAEAAGKIVEVLARRCPVGLKPDAASLRSGECIGCEACVDTCPRGSLSRPALDPARHFVLSALVRSALFFGMGVCLGFCRF